MDIEKQQVSATGIKILAKEGEEQIGRAYLYVLKNDLHESPFGFMEDVFVDEAHRKRGVGRLLVAAVIAEAKVQGCYKLVCTSRNERPDVHDFYKKFEFKEYGLEFRMDLT